MEGIRNVLPLLCYKIDKIRELRYLNVKLNADSDVTVPLFYGGDLMADSSILHSSNYCRIHAKYAKRRLAVKLVFPADLTITGINNCQSGTWFYSIQGVFQIFFEYHSRHTQLKVVTSLAELWKGRQGNPKLPDKLTVTMEEILRGTRCDGMRSSNDQLIPLSQLLAKCELETPMEVICSDENSPPVVDSTSSLSDKSSITTPPTNESCPNPDSFRWFSNDMLCRTQSFSRHCHLEERYLATALVAFLKLVKSESKERNDDLFSSFLEMICNYSSLITDPSKLRCFRSNWGIDEKQNALLCLICEWLGKNMNVFKEPVSRKVEEFKLEHMTAGGDLPSAENLVSEIFPECMRLLVSYWIGLYSVAESTAVGTPPISEELQVTSSGRRAKQGCILGNRVDHSYSSNKDVTLPPGAVVKEDVSTTVGAPPNKRADHSYSSSTPSAAMVGDCAGSNPPLREDHTYVASGCSQQDNEDVANAALIPNMREDHTYVSTKERKTKTGSGGINIAVATNMQVDHGIKDDHDYDLPHAKRFKSALMNGAQCALVLDAGKHPFVQLILEFLNNVLISGVAHVVYTRLVHL